MATPNTTTPKFSPYNYIPERSSIHSVQSCQNRLYRQRLEPTNKNGVIHGCPFWTAGSDSHRFRHQKTVLGITLNIRRVNPTAPRSQCDMNGRTQTHATMRHCCIMLFPKLEWVFFLIICSKRRMVVLYGCFSQYICQRPQGRVPLQGGVCLLLLHLLV